MFRGKGRVLFAVLVIVALAVPAVGVLASGNGTTAASAAAAPGATELNWELVHQAPTGVYLYTIDFPTKDVGYVTGGPDWNNANNGRGAPSTISKTTDGGKTWITTSIANTNGWMRGLACKDAQNCWIAGNNLSAKLLYTTDGGGKWTAFSNKSGYSNWLWSAGYTKSGTTVLAGTTCYDPADSGAKANWVRSTNGVDFYGIQAIPNTYMCYVQWDIECPSANYCYSAGKQYVWRSTNGGSSWTQTNAGNYRWYGLSCTSNTNCWVSGKSPWIKSTTNSGGAWTENTVNGIGGTGQFWDIAMVDSKHGYAAGCSQVATDSSDKCLGKGILYRTDDGVTWNPVANAPKATDFMDLWAASMDDVYLVDFGGKIWHGTGAPQATATPTATETPQTGQVNGIAFNDGNGDAFHDDGEAGVQGATIVLRRGRTEVATAVSNADGVFQFSGLQPGAYTIEEKAAPSGFEKARFFGTFMVEASRTLSVYLGHDAIQLTETPSPTPTETATPTETPSQTPEPSSTPTATATRGTLGGYLPIIIH